MPIAARLIRDGYALWEVADGGNGHFYKIEERGPISWVDARDTAALSGFELASIASAAENAFVYDLATQAGAINAIGRGPWLGGFQPAGSPEPGGGWQWQDGTAFDYTDWFAGEPNNSFGEDALHYFSATGDLPTWNDLGRFDTGLTHYVVEIAAEDVGVRVAENVSLGTNVADILSEGFFPDDTGANALSITGGNLDLDGDGMLAFAIAEFGSVIVNDSDDLDFEAVPVFDLILTGPDAQTLDVRILVTDVFDDPATEGADTQDGSDAADYIDALGGDDLIFGKDGDDTLLGSEGDDSLDGGRGADRVFAGVGDDSVTGGRGNDVLQGMQGDDILRGGVARDLMGGQSGQDTLFGERGEDLIFGGLGDDVLSGGAGFDILGGGAGSDFLNGGFGPDTLIGGEGLDRFYHLGPQHGAADLVADYDATQGDRLVYGGADAASDFGLRAASASGEQYVDVVLASTGQVIWQLIVDPAHEDVLLLAGNQFVTLDLLDF